MAQDSKWSIHDNIWNFYVTDPQLHRKGYTIYKVTCQTFPIKSPETLTELVCWKRYNDFKTLHKSLLALHKALHRRDQFPEFAKPKLFGRFDDTVIEERRQSAVGLLNFIATQPHLYKSLVFKQFLEDGKAKAVPSKSVSIMTPRPANLDIISSATLADGNPPPDLVPLVHKERGLSRGVVSSQTPNAEHHADNAVEVNNGDNSNFARLAMLEGTWNYPQVADNISLDSSTGDETVDTDEDSILTGSLPDTDLAFFDPMGHDSTLTSPDDPPGSLGQSNSWLLASMNMCVELETNSSRNNDETNELSMTPSMDPDIHGSRADTNLSTDSTITNLSVPSSSTLEKFSDHESLTHGSSKSSLSSSGINPGKNLDWDEFDPIRKMSQTSDTSKVEFGKGDLDLSAEWEARSASFGSQKSVGLQRFAGDGPRLPEEKLEGLGSSSVKSSRSQSVGSEKSQDSEKGSSNKSTPSHTSRGLFKRLVSGSPKKPRSVTEQSVSTMDLGGKEDYIYLAASQICMAQNSEANGDFEVAFAYYKSGVGILLQGVQGDGNKSRRDAVRRKTAQYLMKAEDLFNRHLATENVDERRWGADSFLSPSLDLDPSFAFIRGPVRELRNFQVLGTIDKVILVRDKATDETYVFKSIPKSSPDGGRTQSILPTSCPHMVSLHKFYETDDSIFLLLQYASGGKLWTYIGDYLSRDKGHQGYGGIEHHVKTSGVENVNVYSGVKVESNVAGKTESTHKQPAVHAKPSDFSAQGGGHFTNAEKSGQMIKTSQECGVVRFSTLTKETSEESGTVKLDQGLIPGELETAGEEKDSLNDLQGQDMFNDSELRDVFTSYRKQPLDRRLSSLSDDCAQVTEMDSSVISPSTLPEEDHFQSFLQECRLNVEGFSINSFDSEDTQRLSLSCRVKIDSIPGHYDDSPARPLASRQISADEIFTHTRRESRELSHKKVRHSSTDGVFSQSARKSASELTSADVIKNSRQLLQQVDKVLSETGEKVSDGLTSASSHASGDTPGHGAVLEPEPTTSSCSVEEPSIYDANRSSEDDTNEHNSNTNSDNILDAGSVEVRGGVIDSLDDSGVCGGGRPGIEVKGNCDLSPVATSVDDTEQKVNAILNVSENYRPGQLDKSLRGSMFRPTSTPHKLIISRMNSKDMTRSASFECDLKSPTRNRARTVSDLFERLDSTNTEPVRIPEPSIRKWMAQLVTAISRLHSLGIICRDLKPNNVLLGDSGQVFLTYFCHLGQGDYELDWEAVQNLYAAPEVGSINSYDKSCDWWSIGALLFELIVGRTLAECHPGGINSHTCLYVPTFVSAEARGLLEGLLKHNPHERLGSGIAGSEEIKAHPFFTGVDWHALEYS